MTKITMISGDVIMTRESDERVKEKVIKGAAFLVIAMRQYIMVRPIDVSMVE